MHIERCLSMDSLHFDLGEGEDRPKIILELSDDRQNEFGLGVIHQSVLGGRSK